MRALFSRRVFLGQVLAGVLTLPARGESASLPDDFRLLEARRGNLRLLPGPSAETAVWAYNGEVPGPLLRFKKGEEVKIRLVNKLDEPTSLNWHGVRIVNNMDGVGGLTQEAGTTRRRVRLPVYAARQRALLVSSAGSAVCPRATGPRALRRHDCRRGKSAAGRPRHACRPRRLEAR